VKIYHGLNQLDAIFETVPSDDIFLICGKHSFEASGAAAKLTELLAGKNVRRFSDFSANPKYEDAINGTRMFKESSSAVILAVGGGSSMDIAKLIKAFSTSSLDQDNLLANTAQFTDPNIPLIAIPTTAGTGSEATHFAVVYKNKVKHSVAHPWLLPDYVVLDPTLSSSMTPHLTACSGMDALSQAIEAHWNINSTEESRRYSMDAIAGAWETLSTSVHHPTAESREAMMRASFLAGKAINITKTTAPHALSYILSANFGISHGHAVSFFLPAFLKFNATISDSDCLDPRGPCFVKERLIEIAQGLGEKDAFAASNALTTYIENLGLSSRLGPAGLDETVVPLVVEGVNIERLKNNPRLFLSFTI